MSLARLRGLLLRRLPGDRRRPASAPGRGLRGDQAARRLDPGPRGGPRDRRRAPTCGSASRAARSSPPTASTTCPTASSSPARSRTRSRARSASTCRRATRAARSSGVRFRFEGGKVVDASAEKGEEFLIEMLDTDEGARRLGELGIGTNYGITDGTGEILLDEKIGGTVHLAVGPLISRDRRRQRVRDPLGHDLRPAQGRPDRGRRRAAAGRRPVRRLEPQPRPGNAGYSGRNR